LKQVRKEAKVMASAAAKANSNFYRLTAMSAAAYFPAPDADEDIDHLLDDDDTDGDPRTQLDKTSTVLE
jgi:hypothetical protein